MLLAVTLSEPVGGKPAVVLDAPLLLEADWGPLCDFVLMVEVPRETRAERAKARNRGIVE